MTETNPESNLKSEIKDTLELNLLAKFWHTVRYLFKDPAFVVEDSRRKDTGFIKPLKFALSIATPIVLVYAFWKPDFYNYMLNNSDAPVAGMGGFWPSFYEFIIRKTEIVNSIFYGEYTPLVFVVLVAPPVAYILKLIYRKSIRKDFFHFYTATLYITGLLLPLMLVLNSLNYLLNWGITFHSRVNFIVEASIFIYLCYRIFHTSRRPFVNAVLAYAGQYAFSYVILVGTMAILVFTQFDEFSYKPVKAIGLVTIENRFAGILNVAHVQPGSPAYIAGVMPGDAIQSINGKTVTTNDSFPVPTNDMDSLSVEVQRQGKTLTWVINLKPFDSIFHPAGVQFGWDLEIKKRDGNNVVVINEVLHDHAAARAGLEPRDEIVRFGDFDVALFRERYYRTYYAYTSLVPGDSVELDVLRNNSRFSVRIVAEQMQGKRERIFDLHH